MSMSSTQLIERYFEPKIDLIEHLIHYSQNILLVLAPQGGGKTVFADFCVDYPTPDLKKHLLEVSPSLSIEDMMEDIAKGFGMSWPSNDSAPQPNIAVQKIWTLFVDDAQLLTLDKLEALIRLVNFRQEPKRQLHLVLLGDDRLLTLFSADRIRHLAGSYSTIIELGLPRNWQAEWDRASFVPNRQSRAVEPQAFLEEKSDEPLFESKFDTRSPSHFEDVLERDWLQENTEQIAEQAFEQNCVQKNHTASYRHIWLHPVACGVYLGFVVGIGLLIWKGQADKPVLMSEQVEEVQAVSSSISPSAFFSEDPTEEEEAKYANPEPTELALAQPIEPKALEPKVTVKNEAKKPKLAQATKNAKAKAEVTAEKAILAKKSSHFTLQLYSSNEKQKVLAFKQEHGLDKAWLITKKSQGKVWHVLVLGDYLNKAQAQQAVRRLPASMHNAKITPWVREFASVQKEIGPARI